MLLRKGQRAVVRHDHQRPDLLPPLGGELGSYLGPRESGFRQLASMYDACLVVKDFRKFVFESSRHPTRLAGTVRPCRERTADR